MSAECVVAQKENRKRVRSEDEQESSNASVEKDNYTLVYTSPAYVVQIESADDDKSPAILRDALCDIAHMDKYRRFYARESNKQELRTWMSDKHNFVLLILDARKSGSIKWIDNIGRLAFDKNASTRAHVYESVQQSSAHIFDKNYFESKSTLSASVSIDRASVAVFIRYKTKAFTRYAYMGLGALQMMFDDRYKLGDLSKTIRKDVVSLFRFNASNLITEELIGDIVAEPKPSNCLHRVPECRSEIYSLLPVESMLDYYA